MHSRSQRPKGKTTNTRSISCMDMASLTGDKHSQSVVQEKLATATASLNKAIDIYKFIIEAATVSFLKLQIPETLFSGANQSELLFLYTDNGGAVRINKGHLAAHNFLATAGEKCKQLHNLNPQGIHFPKFVTFADDRIEYLLHHKVDFRMYLSSLTANPRKVQRFICQRDFIIKDTILRWRRTKQSKCYSITPRSAIKPTTKKPLPVDDPSLFSLDLTYIASTRYNKSCDVTKERISEEMERMLDAIRGILSRFAITSAERIEELLVYASLCQDGKLYFIDMPAIRVSILDEERPIAPKQSLGITAMLKNCDVSERLKGKLLPYINLADISETNERMYRMHLSAGRGDREQMESSRTRTESEELVSQHLSEVSAQFDTLVKESQELKKEFGIVMKVQLNHYPKDLLENVIRRVYENIIRDPRLSKYYPDKSRIYARLVTAVKSVFLNGLSRNIRARMRIVHMGMGVTDLDFDLYLKYFVEAMTALGVAEDDIEQTREFLDEFRGDVVQRMLDLPDLPDPAQS